MENQNVTYENITHSQSTYQKSQLQNSHSQRKRGFSYSSSEFFKG